jgi:hypothetical protein
MENVFTLNNVALKNSYNKCFTIEPHSNFLINYGLILNISKLLGVIISLNTNLFWLFE